MKATGIVRRIDDLGRVVIPKEIRRTMRIREGDPLDNSLTPEEKFAIAVHSILKRYKEQARWNHSVYVLYWIWFIVAYIIRLWYNKSNQFGGFVNGK